MNIELTWRNVDETRTPREVMICVLRMAADKLEGGQGTFAYSINHRRNEDTDRAESYTNIHVKLGD